MTTDSDHGSPPLTIIFTVVLLAFFFVGFFSIYFCKCFIDNLMYSWYLRHNPGGAPPDQKESIGLDPSIIQSFPTFTYSSVKGFRNEKCALECAICLSEFLDDDVLRLFTVCCHVFHQECIDLWLESHKTCPVCRRGLDGIEKSPEKYSMNGINENEPLEDCLSIRTGEEDEDNERERRERGASISAQEIARQKKMDKFSRSHSTGHSIVKKGGEDKYTLRLPEHLHPKLIRGHNWTGSCTTFGEYKSKTTAGNGGFGEISDFSGGDVNKV